ncbi:MAG: hypothetical protein LAT56_14445 [Wenzhouxiangella sp.]|nr:hypothetical protein [Wenzhouxiangella sp.]
MTPDRIQSAVDRLLSREQCYRPLALLKLIRRVDSKVLAQWESGELKWLEDGLYGHPQACLDELRVAADWARKLGLEARLEAAEQGRRLFRSGADDRLASTNWHRAAPSAQGDLFFDTGFAQARSALNQSLLAADRERAEQALADLSRADPGNEAQADGERLVEALGWLEEAPDDPRLRLAVLDEDIQARARRLLGAAESRRFLAPLWRQLAAAMDPADFDSLEPDRHPSAVLARVEDWAAVVEAVRAVPDYVKLAQLLGRLASAALAAGDREVGLAAVCQLCWRHPKAAQAWLDACRDDELVRRVEVFWDLDPPLAIDLFPAWLVSVAYALPDIPEQDRPDDEASEAWTRFRALRADPTDLTLREWFQTRQPALFSHWLATGR